MLGQGTTPLSNSTMNDADFASKLVRVPKASVGEQKTESMSFHKTLADALRRPKSDSGHQKPDKRLWDACIEMESLMVGRMLKEMRKSVPKTGWMRGGFAEEIFEDMLYDEYAMSLSRNSNLGMAKMLYDELSRKL
jgi:Rod binding domain-containing protein